MSDEISKEKDRIRARKWQAEWHKNNPEKSRAKTERFRHAHPDWHLWYEAKKRAKKKGFEFSLERSDVIIPDTCPVLGIPLFPKHHGNQGQSKSGASPNSPTLDRKDSNKGYTKDNIRVISWRANKLKSDSSVEELEKILVYMRSP